MGDFEKFYNFALRFLSYRPRSEKEVRDKLKVQSEKLKVKDSTAIIDKIIVKLKEKKFVNDEEFARMFLENRLRFKPRSSRLIQMELKQKGIDPDFIEKLINDLKTINPDRDLEQAKKLVEKRIERLKNLKKQEIYEKLGRYLASKGFDWDTIKKSIDAVLDKGV